VHVDMEIEKKVRGEIRPTKIIDIDYEAPESIKQFNRKDRYNTIRPTIKQIEEREDDIQDDQQQESLGSNSFISKIEETLFGERTEMEDQDN